MKKFNNYLFLFIILFVFLINFVLSQKTLVLNGVIYDQFPAYNPSFEPALGSLTKGIVKSTLNPTTRVPELNSLLTTSNQNIGGRIVRPDLFQYFFSSNNNQSSAGYNIAIPINLTLTLNEATGIYTYSNQDFFPIDNKGFDVDSSKRIYRDENKVYHNFHFTLKINSKFTYRGGEIFSFIGDDDFYVYINNQLVIDLGGLHLAESGSVNLDTLGLVKGNTYNIDFFYCERHTTKSTIRFDTNIEILCDHTDYCGVCNGDGSSCCNPLTTCNDNNQCTIDSCPPSTTKIPENASISNYCIHTPKQVPISTNLCFTSQCNITTGNFDQIPIKCLDLSNDCLRNVGCNSSTGCKYESFCNDICQISGQCNGNGTCVTKSSEYCAQELDGNNIDLCKVYSCDSNSGGCIKKDKCQQSSNKCLYTSCNPINGECLVENIPNPYSNNSCVESTCDPDTGLYSSSPLVCKDRSNECLTLVGCNPFSGCEYESFCKGVCDAKDQCVNGTCIAKTSEYCAQELDGNNIDLCKVYSCDSKGCGCIKEDKCKNYNNNTNPCLTSSCKSSTGECFNIEIPSDKCDCGCNITNKCWRSNCTKDGKCSPVLREEIDDNDQCTDDHCDPCTGIITHTTASKCLNCNKCS